MSTPLVADYIDEKSQGLAYGLKMIFDSGAGVFG